MLILAMFQWWYSDGWRTLAAKIKTFLVSVVNSFSVPTLIRTLGQPWRQIVAYRDPNQNLQQRMRNVVDNIVSRLVGLMIRSMTLVAALVVVSLGSLVGLVSLVVWPVI